MKNISAIPVFEALPRNIYWSSFITPIYPYSCLFWMGCVFAKADKLKYIQDKLKNYNLLNPVFDLIFIYIIIVSRNEIFGENIDLFIVPFFIVFSLDLLSKFYVVYKIFVFFGTHSMNIWLIHTFLIYYYGSVASFIMKGKYALVEYALTLGLCLILSISIDFVYAKCAIGIKYIKNYFLRFESSRPK